MRDTLIAGGLCDEAATRFIVENGRAAIEWLIEQGVPFTKDDAAELGFLARAATATGASFMRRTQRATRWSLR
ncbi:MAG: unnamed protein product [uncultured Paraburkholderia sp.]|nr:MAG: unnamed protein product [uncultured Paraburkholderia sp.]